MKGLFNSWMYLFQRRQVRLVEDQDPARRSRKEKLAEVGAWRSHFIERAKYCALAL